MPDMNLDAVISKDLCCYFSKFAAVISAVIAYYDCRLRLLLFQIVCYALLCSGNDVAVHAVGTSTHYTTQSGSAKGKLTVEGVFYLCFVILHCNKLLMKFLVIRSMLQPNVVFFVYVQLPFSSFWFQKVCNLLL